ncbi:formate/nitrite transporter family protein [Candidatus Nitronereus thalassa]|uniref:Formate/nitrite transporter family protein n=1 Tax=Candidatus Nitronereus thalassa TaxID=3020898 RepID=A0ABU3K9P5_9BACT|nr:formate/nitrite transporter family protein [Candidatus Nitronereus thalassa]MDT7043165.1 formate/nitrite transporter family protein [Candidatus Nitronereus thalassa]
MYMEDLKRMAEVSRKKVEYCLNAPGGYFLLSALAGIYLGLGICLIFSVGAPFAAEGSVALKLVMGTSFGVALTLVIFAGSELFTGNNMVCTIGALARTITWKHVGWIFVWSFVGNLIGSLFVAWMIVQSGVMAKAPQMDLLMKVAAMKMSASAWELFIRGILCNVLVCLAVWMAAKTKNEAAKIMLIFWCLFAFIGSGFEHSIANQSLLGMALFLPHGEAISWSGFAWNQVFVGLGNIVGGAVLVGSAYWLSSPYRMTDSVVTQSEQTILGREAQESFDHSTPALTATNSVVPMKAGFVAVLKHERGMR